MSILQSPRRAADHRFLEARALRISRRVEALCRRHIPDCRAASVMNDNGGSFDLSLGLRDGTPEERVWARELKSSELDSDAAVERLARFLEVWIEPLAAPVAGHGATRSERSVAV